MITKTGLLNEGLRAVVRANQSFRVRAVMDYLSGRYKWVYHDPLFPMQEDPYGNQFLNTDGFAVEGVIQWEVRMWKDYAERLRTGEFGLNPRRLFRPMHRPQVAPVQNAQTPAATVM